jgi:L-alanine-DL-glutamate epimerase-like enolase superfamily enzyme
VSGAVIEDVQASTYVIPTDFPESDGTIEWNKTVLVVVEAVSQGTHGIGYTYADVSTATLIKNVLANNVIGQSAMAVQRSWLAMISAVRNIGRPGMASAAISAVDIALWDLKAKLLNLPLYELLGSVRPCVEVYGSGGFTSYPIPKLQEQLRGWVDQGIDKVKMKVGRNPAEDLQRVKAARDAIGPNAELFVDGNGAFTTQQALELAGEFSRLGVTWFEEPVSSDDLEGLRFIRDHGPVGMNIAAGEYGYDLVYFRKMLEAGAVDTLQADVTRCMGITDFIRVGALCDAYFIPLSGNTSPTLHGHLGCVVKSMCNVEYFHDHVRIEQMLFEGALTAKNGVLTPNSTQPGLGIKLRQDQAKQFAA